MLHLLNNISSILFALWTYSALAHISDNPLHIDNLRESFWHVYWLINLYVHQGCTPVKKIVRFSSVFYLTSVLPIHVGCSSSADGTSRHPMVLICSSLKQDISKSYKVSLVDLWSLKRPGFLGCCYQWHDGNWGTLETFLWPRQLKFNY